MIELSEHQKSVCKMCAEDSMKYNHCSWCGLTFQTQDELLDHLDIICLQKMTTAFDNFFK